MGFRYNFTGRLLDLCADLIVANARSFPITRPRGYGRLSPGCVREVRKSQEKIASIAAEHDISEAMVIKIRARQCYRWVR